MTEQSNQCDSGLSETEAEKVSNSQWYAAVRFYVDNSVVHYVSIDDIQDFNPLAKCPYDALLSNGMTEDDNTVYEPAIVMKISKSLKQLQEYGGRWPKPNKRRSVVLTEIANKNEKVKKEKLKQVKPTNAANSTTSKKGKNTKQKPLVVNPPDPVEKAINSVKDQISNMSSLKFVSDCGTTHDKDLTIEKLKEQIRKLQEEKEINNSRSQKENKQMMIDPVNSMEPNLNKTSSLLSFSKSPVTPCSVNLKRIDSHSTNENESPIATRQMSITPRNLFAGINESTYSKRTQATAVVKSSDADRIITSDNRCPTDSSSSRAEEMSEKLHVSNASSHSPRKNQQTTKKKLLKSVSEKRRKSGNAPHKKEQKKKYVRKTKECLYDTDDYENSDCEKMEPMTQWDSVETDRKTGLEKNVKMQHLHFGVSVPYRKWVKARKATTSSSFLRLLVTPHIWSREKFIKKAVQVQRTSDTADREPLTPKKFETRKRAYTQFLLMRGLIPKDTNTSEEVKSRKSRINKCGRELGIRISQEREKYKTLIASGALAEENDHEFSSEAEASEESEDEVASDEKSS